MNHILNSNLFSLTMTELQLYIKTYFGITDEDLERAASFFVPTSIQQGSFILKSGTNSDFIGIVKSGIIHEFVTLDDKEVTKWIDTRGYFVLDLTSFFFDQPAQWDIQALTDCEIFIISKEDYLKMGSEIEEWPELEKLFITKCFSLLEARLLTLLSMSAEGRYRNFVDFKGEMFKDVPTTYIASMLAIPVETLRMFRNEYPK